jgi:hypothetical protein
MKLKETTQFRNAFQLKSVLMGLFAVVGSMVYGASIGPFFGLKSLEGAIWLTLAAGLSWIVLGAVLVLTTRRDVGVLMGCCLRVMTHGMIVLMVGLPGNLYLQLKGSVPGLGLGFATATVVYSNWVMLKSLLDQLGREGVGKVLIVTCWMLFLNGIGVWLFLELHGLVQEFVR